MLVELALDAAEALKESAADSSDPPSEMSYCCASAVALVGGTGLSARSAIA